MNINRTTPHEPEHGLAKSEHVKRLFLGGLLAATTLAGGLAFASEVPAATTRVHRNSNTRCTCASTSGLRAWTSGSRPADNPIWVADSASPGPCRSWSTGRQFGDEHDSSIVIKVGGADPGIGACPKPEGTPDEVTESDPGLRVDHGHGDDHHLLVG